MEATKEFIEVVFADFTNIKEDLIHAIETNDLAAYKDARHKTLTALELLKAAKLQSLLKTGKEVLATGESTPTDSIFEELERTFSDFLNDLKGVKMATFASK